MLGSANYAEGASSRGRVANNIVAPIKTKHAREHEGIADKVGVKKMI